MCQMLQVFVEDKCILSQRVSVLTQLGNELSRCATRGGKFRVNGGSVLRALEETGIVVDLAFKLRPPCLKGLERDSIATK